MALRAKKIYHGGYNSVAASNPNRGDTRIKLSSILEPNDPNDAALYDGVVNKWLENSNVQPYQLYQMYQKNDLHTQNQFIEIKNTNASASVALLKGKRLDADQLVFALTRRMLKEYTINETWRCTSEQHPRAFGKVYNMLRDECKVPDKFYRVGTIRHVFVQQFMKMIYPRIHTTIPSFSDRQLWIEEACNSTWECSYDVLREFVVMVCQTFQLVWEISQQGDYHLPGTTSGMYFKYQSHKSLVFICIMFYWKGNVNSEMEAHAAKFKIR